ncbi:unnamed protein product [Bursaphelenchus xylophilus]|uniref:(pine wood nematode) hypothetical protein n=1 Tax=Bursaphelenchus xylophilus TaxID=6326 RepID=A0A1I7RS76_BURXY|nr:unnamed protein product [Bursaphelenchus xylophilus]CAG9123148.1 unnamed protein product [Bursaphelenchus xylophilus]
MPETRKLCIPAIYNLSINPLGGFVTHESGDDLEANRPPGILKKPQDQQSLQEASYKKSGEYPIPLALTILALWIALSAAMFCLWEHDWGYLTSVYFFFVSISTVGLGDVVPTKPDMMLVNFFLILIGLALLSMCINLIQDYIEKLIEQILEQYIEEIEKMAQIVTNTDDLQQEEAKPFEVGMTDMLTVPLTTMTEHPYQNTLVRSAKDWVAEKIVGNVLMNRLDPHHSSSESSEDELDDETRKNSASTQQTKDDTISRASVKSHKKAKTRALQRHALFGYNLPTLRAIQAIETVKMRTDIHGDFKSRMFAKFATNSRWNKIVDTQPPPPPTKMVSFSVQTSPIQGRDRRRINKTDYGVGLGSMDSFSSSSRRNGPDSSTRSFDIDSLCSSAYNDVVFGPYTTDSIPQFPTDKKNSLTSPSSPGSPITPTILLNRSSNSPIGCSDIAIKLPHRRYSTSNCLDCPSGGAAPHTQMPFRRCPSCYENLNRDESKAEEKTMKRIREFCGIMPGDFLKQRRTETNDDGLNHRSNLRDFKRSSHLSPT